MIGHKGLAGQAITAAAAFRQGPIRADLILPELWSPAAQAIATATPIQE
jgi:hypothetical protein